MIKSQYTLDDYDVLEHIIFRKPDNAWIPFDKGNRDFKEYCNLLLDSGIELDSINKKFNVNLDKGF